MAADDSPPSLSFSTKEMLIRLEGKVDALLVSQGGLDTRVALVEQNITTLKERFEGHAASAGHETVRVQIEAVNRRLAYGAGFVAALWAVAEFVIPHLS